MATKRKKDKSWSAFCFGMSPWKYPSNWFKNIGQWFRNLKYVWQRACYGYSDFDIWNLSDYHVFLLGEMLDQLAENPSGFPTACQGIDIKEIAEEDDKEALEAWKTTLKNLALNFHKAYEPRMYWQNEYLKTYYEFLDKTRKIEDTGVSLKIRYEDNEEFQRVREKYWERDKEIEELRENAYKEGLDGLKRWHRDLWD